MAITKLDLDRFNSFAMDRISDGDCESIATLAERWEQLQSEQQEVRDAVREGQSEIQSGGGRLASAVFADIRQKLDSTK